MKIYDKNCFDCFDGTNLFDFLTSEEKEKLESYTTSPDCQFNNLLKILIAANIA